MLDPFGDGEDQILLLIDNNEVTLNNVITIVDNAKLMNKPDEYIAEKIRHYVATKAYTDLTRQRDGQVMAEALNDAYEKVRMFYHRQRFSYRNDYWVSVAKHYIQKHAEQTA